MNALPAAPAASTPGDTLRDYIARDREQVLALTAGMPQEKQDDYLAIHDQALAAVEALERRRPELADADSLCEHLLEIGCAKALPLFQDRGLSLDAAWTAADDPAAMLALLEALRPPRYASLLRGYMIDAIEIARSLDIPSHYGPFRLEFTEGLEEALLSAGARARSETALAALPKTKAIRKRALAEGGQKSESAIALVVGACAENVSWGAKEVTARVADLGFIAAFCPANAEQIIREGPLMAYDSAGGIAAREAGEQGRTEMRARLAQALRGRFPDPFA